MFQMIFYKSILGLGLDVADQGEYVLRREALVYVDDIADRHATLLANTINNKLLTINQLTCAYGYYLYLVFIALEKR